MGTPDKLRKVVQIELQRRIADPLQHRVKAGKQRLIGIALVVEWWQRQDPGDAEPERVLAQPDSVGERAAPRADHEPLGWQTRLQRRFQQRDALVDRERRRLPRGAKHHETMASVFEQVAGVCDEAGRIGVEVIVERG